MQRDDLHWLQCESRPVRRRISVASVSAVAALVGLCCAPGKVVDPAPPAPVAAIQVVLGSNSMSVGGTAQATATLLDSRGQALTGRTVTWSSANPGVASVSSQGAITALADGNTAITAASEGRSGTAGLTVAAATPPPPPPPSSGRWVTGYYVGYQRDLYPETEIDFSTLTHVTVGRIRPTTTGGLVTDFDIDPITGPAMARTIATRAHQAQRKALLMLGGAGQHDAFVGAASSANRGAFVQRLLQVLDDFGYDGLDIDWEPINSSDQAPLLALLQALRAGRPGIILTMPVAWKNANFPTVDPWYLQAAAVVDQVNMMTYEMAGNWGGWESWHSAALHDAQAAHPTSVEASASAYRAAGIPAAKIGVGVASYGSCWQGTAAPRQALPVTADVVASDNDMSYANIMSQYYVGSARVWDAIAQVPYLSFATGHGPKACSFISYEDEQSVTAKGSFVKANGYGGAILWTIGEGHLSTAAAGQRDPLARALYTAIAP